MESIFDSLTSEKLYPPGGTNLLDLEEFSDGDFLSNVPFSGDQMEDFSSELFSSFFDDHLSERPQFGDRTSILHMDIEGSPGKLLFIFPLSWMLKFSALCVGH
ncbi:unnamed protein product [Tetraodon nigroviridis]|uniref:(spotted green pufferfish) hypothetical protein n=1 Tax=Tetraodon nigroviridis TaxID=99883 RepID=Q4T4C7_TETNG|nr:unnamed protein product [Tetraodon nigroviridis]